MELINSSQPYLYTDHILYCHAEYSIGLYFGDHFEVRPWKIRNRNLVTGEDIEVPTQRYDEVLGRVVLEVNPSVSIDNDIIKIYWTAGFSNGKDTPIVYRYCSMESEDLTLSKLSNFTILAPYYCAAKLPSGLLYKLEDSGNNEPLILADKILEIPKLDLTDINKITSIFNSDNFIIGGTNPENILSSYIIDKELNIAKRLKNSYNYDVYKCSVFGSTLAYTVHTNKYSANEHRSIVIENMV